MKQKNFKYKDIDIYLELGFLHPVIGWQNYKYEGKDWHIFISCVSEVNNRKISIESIVDKNRHRVINTVKYIKRMVKKIEDFKENSEAKSEPKILVK